MQTPPGDHLLLVWSKLMSKLSVELGNEFLRCRSAFRARSTRPNRAVPPLIITISLRHFLRFVPSGAVLADAVVVDGTTRLVVDGITSLVVDGGGVLLEGLGEVVDVSADAAAARQCAREGGGGRASARQRRWPSPDPTPSSNAF